MAEKADKAEKEKVEKTEKAEKAEEPEVEPIVIPEVKKRPKVAWSDDLSHDSEEERGTK